MFLLWSLLPRQEKVSFHENWRCIEAAKLIVSPNFYTFLYIFMAAKHFISSNFYTQQPYLSAPRRSPLWSRGRTSWRLSWSSHWRWCRLWGWSWRGSRRTCGSRRCSWWAGGRLRRWRAPSAAAGETSTGRRLLSPLGPVLKPIMIIVRFWTLFI